MKKVVACTLMLVSLNTFAISKEGLAECIMNRDEHTQALTSIVIDEARAGRILKAEYDKYIQIILSEEVKTCRQISSIAAEKIAEIFKATPTISN